MKEIIYQCDAHGGWDASRESGCPGCVAEYRGKINAVAAERDRLRTELAAAQKDAERWREIEKHFVHEQCGPNIGWTIGDLVLQGNSVTDAVDAAIDAATEGK